LAFSLPGLWIKLLLDIVRYALKTEVDDITNIFYPYKLQLYWRVSATLKAQFDLFSTLDF
jgi:hypothetical protein